MRLERLVLAYALLAALVRTLTLYPPTVIKFSWTHRDGRVHNAKPILLYMKENRR